MKANFIERYRTARCLTQEICEPIPVVALDTQTMPDVSPPKWHLGHTSWYFETFVLKSYLKDYDLFNPKYPVIFNSYYNFYGERLDKVERGDQLNISLEEVFEYRNYVDAHIIELIRDLEHSGTTSLVEGASMEKLTMLLELGLNHEQQHQELLIYDVNDIYFKTLPASSYTGSSVSSGGSPAPLSFLPFDGGLIEIGFCSQSGSFFFDNEKPRHKVYLYPYGIANRLVSNQEFLDFIDDGGYENPLLWLSDGWEWINDQNINRPRYWNVNQTNEPTGTRKQVRTIHSLRGEIDFDGDRPVSNISYYEAEAYARWSGNRLPTEAEWEHAAICTMERLQGTNGNSMLDENFLESQKFAPEYNSNGESSFGGDLWEWTGSSYLPYPRYKRDVGALGEYNGKFMSGQMVLKGGSFATPESHYRHSYRNFYHPTKRWQLSGIRLARDL